jgi:hypothetical protein
MPAFSKQFTFIINTGSFTATSVAIPSTVVAPDGSTLFLSNPEQGDGYWGATSGLHTVSYTVTPNFEGTITTHASLASLPAATDWFEINSVSKVYGPIINPVITTSSYYVNFTGNFVWIRSSVQRSPNQPNGSVLFVSYNR